MEATDVMEAISSFYENIGQAETASRLSSVSVSSKYRTTDNREDLEAADEEEDDDTDMGCPTIIPIDVMVLICILLAGYTFSQKDNQNQNPWAHVQRHNARTKVWMAVSAAFAAYIVACIRPEYGVYTMFMCGVFTLVAAVYTACSITKCSLTPDNPNTEVVEKEGEERAESTPS
jgi:hypothetical protein